VKGSALWAQEKRQTAQHKTPTIQPVKHLCGRNQHYQKIPLGLFLNPCLFIKKIRVSQSFSSVIAL